MLAIFGEYVLQAEHQQYSTKSGAVFDGGQQGTAKLISLKKGYNGRLIFGETFNKRWRRL
jgi:hypothetical protein